MTPKQLAQDIRNAYEWHDREALEQHLSRIGSVLPVHPKCCGQYATCMVATCVPRHEWRASMNKGDQCIKQGDSCIKPVEGEHAIAPESLFVCPQMGADVTAVKVGPEKS